MLPGQSEPTTLICELPWSRKVVIG
jgi:hypothetical protein